MKRLICFFFGHHWERSERRLPRPVPKGVLYITCERCSKTEVVL